jgi:nodulation protein A
VAELSDAERGALKALTAAVYPPETAAVSAGRTIQWAAPQHGILISTPAGELVAYVGLVVRAGALDGTPVTIGGVGSVKTHPRFEGRGYASAGLRRAAAVLADDHGVDFSLLVCRDHLLPFYERLGWHLFAGRLLVQQPDGPTEFTHNRPMVRPGRRAAPAGGLLDLQGPPW